MKQGILLLAVLTLLPLAALAQMHGGMHGGGQPPMIGGQHMMGPGMMDNLGMMAHMMEQMQQMIGPGQMSPEAQQQMLQMMRRMGQIMQEMPGAQSAQRQGQQRQELQEMQQRLDALQRQGQHQH
jgi:hypothetical protein